MQLNADMGERVVVDSSRLAWVESPASGVHRRMLARSGAEDAVATSIVRYAPGAGFGGHTHPLGEEFLVLDGCFSDEQGDYPAGTYVKNPPGSSHAPFSREGCTLFVKLRHLRPHNAARVVVRPTDHGWQPGLVPGLSVQPLDHGDSDHTALVRWAPGTYFNRHVHRGGEEILVLEGVFQDEHQAYPAGTWIRSPHMSTHQPFSEDGCLILVKVGHL